MMYFVEDETLADDAKAAIAGVFAYAEEGRDDVEGNIANADIVIGRHRTDDYEGSVVVIYRTGDKWYVVDSSHCSCNSFSWAPTETNPASILIDYGSGWQYVMREEDIAVLKSVVGSHATDEQLARHYWSCVKGIQAKEIKDEFKKGQIETLLKDVAAPVMVILDQLLETDGVL